MKRKLEECKTRHAEYVRKVNKMLAKDLREHLSWMGQSNTTGHTNFVIHYLLEYLLNKQSTLYWYWDRYPFSIDKAPTQNAGTRQKARVSFD